MYVTKENKSKTTKTHFRTLQKKPDRFISDKKTFLNEISTLLNAIHKDKLKMDTRSETIKLLEESIGRTLDDRNQSKIFYDPPSRVMEIKAKMHETGCSGLVHWDDPEGWGGEGGGR